MVSSVTNNGSTPPVTQSSARAGLGALDQGDFLKLLTTQLTQQDPTDPVDNKEMVAQMAQFSSLAGIAEMSDTLKAISAKLDLLFGQAEETPAADDSASGDATETDTETETTTE